MVIVGLRRVKCAHGIDLPPFSGPVLRGHVKRSILGRDIPSPGSRKQLRERIRCSMFSCRLPYHRASILFPYPRTAIAMTRRANPPRIHLREPIGALVHSPVGNPKILATIKEAEMWIAQPTEVPRRPSQNAPIPYKMMVPNQTRGELGTEL